MKHDTDLGGRTLASRYDVLRMIGSGGMGAVYRAYDRELDEIVALKVIHDAHARDPVFMERFRREVKLARRVTHPNVARMFELGHDADIVFCTMELVEGETLSQRLARRKRLPVGESVAIACALCEGLAAAHEAGVVHRDIKPANVLLARDGRVALADFGVAAVESTRIAGTPGYMAPEQVRGDAPAPAMDIYAVGLLLYEMISGTRAVARTTDLASPGHRDARLAVGGDVTADLVQIIAQAMAPDPAARIHSASQLAKLLARFTDDRSPTRPVPGDDDAPSVRTVVVMPPRATAGSALHVAYGIYTGIVAALTRHPRVRVVPKQDSLTAATVVTLVADEALDVTIAPPAPAAPLHLSVSLGIPEIELSAMTVAGAVLAAVDHRRVICDANATAATDLVLRARQIGEHDVLKLDSAIELLERADALAPQQPTTVAALAIARVRHSFYSNTESADAIARATAAVGSALALAPDRAEAQLAAGHLELQTGNPVVAAQHFRRAIACAPYLAEAHNSLGRMLLEASFLTDGLARIEDSLAYAPEFQSTRWEVARAYALEKNWQEYDRLSNELLAAGSDRPIQRLRTALWRCDRELARRRASDPSLRALLEPEVLAAVLAVLDDSWPRECDQVTRFVLARATARRRRTFLMQIVAELAAFAGDTATCSAFLVHASNNHLFDLHWLDRCPLLGVLREGALFRQVRARVKSRADAILDALYGDRDAPDESTSATEVT